MKSNKVSIIVPIYKVEQYLKRCLDSLVNQTYKNIEIILVDDGSPDQCPQICDDYAREDSRIKVIHKENGGLSDARNTGLKAATGEYVMYVDSDDYIERDSCEKLINNAVENVDLVIGACKEIRPTGVSFQQHTNLEENKTYTAKEYMLLSIEKNEWYAPAWLNLYRKAFLINNNLYYKVGYYFEDIEMLPRLFLANPTVRYVNYPFYNYVIRDGSIMMSGINNEKKRMILDNYNGWMNQFSLVEDATLQKYLYGVLVKYYVASVSLTDIEGWKIKRMDFRFAWYYALNRHEKTKVALYNYCPGLYKKCKKIFHKLKEG